MQTSFTPEQLRDPDLAESNKVLRTCVHCGFCTATCPTFRLLGDELDSPRGRIYLIKDMLESGRDASALEAKHIDRCLSCLSCMTTCPSGVNYMHLVDHARAHIERTFRRPWHERVLRAALAAILPYPARLRAALAAARLGRGLGALLPGSHPLGKRLKAMLALAPARCAQAASVGPGVYPAQGSRKARVALLAGCAQQVLAPEINAATIRLLTRLGVEVVIPASAGCCGALTLHMGRHDEGMAAAAANVAAWSRAIADGGLDAIVINASGCGTSVKEYGFLFRNAAPELRDAAARVAGLARDVTEYLTAFGYAPTRPPSGLTVAYHSACSLQHGQQVTEEPKALLAQAGFTVTEPAEAHLCCGSAGTYNLLQPDLAGRLRARKLENLRATRPDLIAAGNIGCLTQLAGDGIPVAHTVALLDWMAGGPAPEGLPGARS
ncbi:MAG: glycolate oxidase subunit GlcF [Rhodospirillales bacterium]|nr:glycolate oxidase subunit GlcF [Rhodospirillales bacterium]